jgi:hypothetical protein
MYNIYFYVFTKQPLSLVWMVNFMETAVISISTISVHLVLRGNLSVQLEQSGMNGSKTVTGIISFLRHQPLVDAGVSTTKLLQFVILLIIMFPWIILFAVWIYVFKTFAFSTIKLCRWKVL